MSSETSESESSDDDDASSSSNSEEEGEKEEVKEEEGEGRKVVKEEPTIPVPGAAASMVGTLQRTPRLTPKLTR